LAGTDTQPLQPPHPNTANLHHAKKKKKKKNGTLAYKGASDGTGKNKYQKRKKS
jgi:hypothetical protein